LIKEAEEVAAVEAALAVIEAVAAEVLPSLAPGQSEAEAAWRILSGLRERGAGEAFETIVAAGPNAAKPHALPGGRRLAEGDTIVLDMGARLDGYCSDITRTAWLGRPSPRFKEIYGLVREAQLAAIAGIRPGMTTVEADRLARAVIDQAGYGEAFGHSLGHGVGLAVHEGPSLSPLRSEVLQPGMVHTLEPGVYLPDWGGVRLEVMALVTRTGVRVLGNLDWFYGF
jgi:Xaa-Pro aminopeptidase